EGVAGVAAGGLDDGVAGLEQSFLLCPLDDVGGDPRLDRAGGVEELALGEDAVLELEHRGVVYGVEDGTGNLGVPGRHAAAPREGKSGERPGAPGPPLRRLAPLSAA